MTDMTSTSDASRDARPEVTTTADLYDEHGEDLQSCAVQFRHYGGRVVFSGVVSTVRCHRDNAIVKAALAEPGDGRVLVVDGGTSLESALMGDLIAASAVANGWAGVVIHGAVRDVAALRELPLGALALGSNPRKSAKDGVGDRDVTVSFGGVDFVPGRRLWADEDGILVTRA
jgi:regulator of ribonuclease activity A